MNDRHRMHRAPSCWPPALAAIQATAVILLLNRATRGSGADTRRTAAGEGVGSCTFGCLPRARWGGPGDLVSVAAGTQARGHAASSELRFLHLLLDLGLKGGRNGHLSAGLWFRVTTCAACALSNVPFTFAFGRIWK